jgi:hypothetical protein
MASTTPSCAAHCESNSASWTRKCSWVDVCSGCADCDALFESCSNGLWAQCGGDQGWTGATCCPEGSICHKQSVHYSQCIPSDSLLQLPGTTASVDQDARRGLKIQRHRSFDHRLLQIGGSISRESDEL